MCWNVIVVEECHYEIQVIKVDQYFLQTVFSICRRDFKEISVLQFDY